MDLIDRKILVALQADATLPIQQVADRVGLSQTPCWKRIQKLEQTGVIRRRVAIVDPAALGLGLSVFVAITTDDHSPGWRDRFAEVVYLYAPLPVLLKRVARRTNNPYGRAAAQRGEFAGYVATVEPLIRGGATTELDATAPVPELAHRVLRLLRN